MANIFTTNVMSAFVRELSKEAGINDSSIESEPSGIKSTPPDTAGIESEPKSRLSGSGRKPKIIGPIRSLIQNKLQASGGIPMEYRHFTR